MLRSRLGRFGSKRLPSAFLAKKCQGQSGSRNGGGTEKLRGEHERMNDVALTRERRRIRRFESTAPLHAPGR